MSSKLRFAAVALVSASQVTNAAYNLVKNYSGQTFFDSWSYYGGFDNLTNRPFISLLKLLTLRRRISLFLLYVTRAETMHL